MSTTIKQYDNIPKNTVGLKGVTKRLLILKIISNCGMLCLGPRTCEVFIADFCQWISEC